MSILQYLKDAYDYDVVRVWSDTARVNVFTVKELLDSKSGILTVEPITAIVYPECGLYTFEIN